VGLCFGRQVSGKIISSEKPFNIGLQQSETAKPTKLNVLLNRYNDIGMLNSELYGTLSVFNKMLVNAGLTFLFTEYTTNNKIEYDFNNDRFRLKSLMGLISISYKPFNN